MIQFSLRKKNRFFDGFFRIICIFLGYLLVCGSTKDNSYVFAQNNHNGAATQNNHYKPNPAPLPMGYNAQYTPNRTTGQTSQSVQARKNAPVPSQYTVPQTQTVPNAHQPNVHPQSVQRRNAVQHQGEIVQKDQGDRLLAASVSQAAMQEALKRMPWNGFTPQARTQVQSILSGQTLYRRLPQQSVYCEPIMLNFLLDHPDTVVAMWEKLGVTQISLKEHGRPGRFVLRESVGSVGYVEVIYRSDKLCVVYSKGSYKGSFIPQSVEGETILLLQNSFEKDEDGEPYVVVQLDAFVKIHNFGADVFAKLFAPMLGKVADNNLEQTIAFIGNVSESAQSNPEIVKRMALKLESVRKEVRDEFIQVAYQTAQLAIDRNAKDSLASHPYGRALLESQQNLAQNRSFTQYEQQRDIPRKIETGRQQSSYPQNVLQPPKQPHSQSQPTVNNNTPMRAIVPEAGSVSTISQQTPLPVGKSRTSVVSIPISKPKEVEKPAPHTISLSESLFGSSKVKLSSEKEPTSDVSVNDTTESTYSNPDLSSFKLGEMFESSSPPQSELAATEPTLEVVVKEEKKEPPKVSLIKTSGGAVFKTPTLK